MTRRPPEHIKVGKRTEIGSHAAYMLVSNRSGLRNDGPWQDGNTAVTLAGDTNDTRMYLHGNAIAGYSREFDMLFISLAEHPTATTISRINHVLAELAMGKRLWRSKGSVWYGDTTHPKDAQRLDPKWWYRIETYDVDSDANPTLRWGGTSHVTSEPKDVWPEEVERTQKRSRSR